MYAYTMSFGSLLFHSANTRYEWMAGPYSAGTCTPQEAPSFAWRTTYRIEWNNTVCGACPLRAQCVVAGQDHRIILVGECHSQLQERRIEMGTDAFKE